MPDRLCLASASYCTSCVLASRAHAIDINLQSANEDDGG